MIATKTLLLIVVVLSGRENGGKAENCRVLARYIGIVSLTRFSTDGWCQKYNADFYTFPYISGWNSGPNRIHL